jgi:hypothetical protein
MADMTVESSAEPMEAPIGRLIQAEIADPTGSRRFAAEVPNANGDLVNDEAARDELRAAAKGLLGGGSTIGPGSPDRRGQ